ncbi:hypothetical protein [Endozoicomonas lisbonensis]|uniref:Immunity protein 72 domain-containing protein n=1 Tax=Endozoicomonas lisbonensis TaxID=3120522 RepID=A0ABV2SP74_9GAMM
MKKWLVERLSKNRQDAPVWAELASVIEEFWDTYFFPEAERLDASKSLFTAHSDDIDRRLSELGDFFDVFLPMAEHQKPLAVAWRTREIHEKDAASVINSILDRNFPELHARWEIMYCLLGAEYTYDNLRSQTEIEIARGNLDDYMMTSRGRLWVDYRQMQQVYPDLAKEDFVELVRSEIDKVKPVHIVYDGELFLLYIDWVHDRLSWELNQRQITNEFVAIHSRLPAWQDADIHRTTDFDHTEPRPPREYMGFDEIPCDFSPIDLHYDGTLT